jgi:hypothetical protein
MLVSLTLSTTRQCDTSSVNGLMLQRLTIALTKLDTSNALPPRIHIVRPGGADDARLISSRDRPRIELYHLLRKRIHRDSQQGDNRPRRASKSSPIHVVKKVQSAPGPAARALKNLKLYEAAWAAFEMLPLELAKRLTDDHEHGGLGQCRQRGDDGIRLSNGFPAVRRLAVEGEEHRYDCKQCSSYFQSSRRRPAPYLVSGILRLSLDSTACTVAEAPFSS